MTTATRPVKSYILEALSLVRSGAPLSAILTALACGWRFIGAARTSRQKVGLACRSAQAVTSAEIESGIFSLRVELSQLQRVPYFTCIDSAASFIRAGTSSHRI